MPTALDSFFQVKIGFGTGEDFVPAAEVAPDLQFDRPEEVSPPIEDVFFLVRPLPMLQPTGHDGDTLIMSS